jgi:hypothetical protein
MRFWSKVHVHWGTYLALKIIITRGPVMARVGNSEGSSVGVADVIFFRSACVQKLSCLCSGTLLLVLTCVEHTDLKKNIRVKLCRAYQLQKEWKDLCIAYPHKRYLPTVKEFLHYLAMLSGGVYFLLSCGPLFQRRSWFLFVNKKFWSSLKRSALFILASCGGMILTWDIGSCEKVELN